MSRRSRKLQVKLEKAAKKAATRERQAQAPPPPKWFMVSFFILFTVGFFWLVASCSSSSSEEAETMEALGMVDITEEFYEATEEKEWDIVVSKVVRFNDGRDVVTETHLIDPREGPKPADGEVHPASNEGRIAVAICNDLIKLYDDGDVKVSVKESDGTVFANNYYSGDEDRRCKAR